MLRTLTFSTEDLLSVIEAELDKRFYGVEFVPSGQAGVAAIPSAQRAAKIPFPDSGRGGQTLQRSVHATADEIKNESPSVGVCRAGVLQGRSRRREGLPLLRPPVQAAGCQNHPAATDSLFLPVHRIGHSAPNQPRNML